MKKITFLMLHFGFGGVESAIANQANMLCDKFNVEIVSLYKLNYESPYTLDKNIKVIYLSDLRPNREEFINFLRKKNLFNAFKEGLKALKILYLKENLMKKFIKKCNSDIIVSTRLNFNKKLGKYAKKNVIKIAQEHVYHKNNQKYINSLIKSVKKIDYLMPVSKELTKFYKDRVTSKTKCKYIRHALDFKINAYEFNCTNTLVAVARLSKEKGFSDLIDVISIVKRDIPNIKLNLIGDGNEKENLKNKIKECNLTDNIKMHGFKNRKEINKILKKCSIYCMTSFEESFGLSVIESMAFGIPCVAFDDAKGVLEIINKNNGVIVKNRDKKKMAEVICSLLNDENKLKKFSKGAYEKSLEFSYENVQKDWIKFYSEVQNGTNNK